MDIVFAHLEASSAGANEYHQSHRSPTIHALYDILHVLSLAWAR